MLIPALSLPASLSSMIFWTRTQFFYLHPSQGTGVRFILGDVSGPNGERFEMAVPQTKAELLDAIDTTFAKLMSELQSLPLDRVGEASLDGHVAGTKMSMHDLVAYLVGWNELVLKWHRRQAQGLDVDFPETGFKWNELGLLAQKFYADYAAIPFSDLLERLRVAKASLVALIESHSDETLYGRPWYGKWTMGRMIQFNSSSPYANARGRIRKWKKATAGA